MIVLVYFQKCFDYVFYYNDRLDHERSGVLPSGVISSNTSCYAETNREDAVILYC